MKYFLDTEFKEKPNMIDLISIGIVAEDGREYYVLCKDFNLKEVWRDEWLKNNVLLPIYKEHVGGDARNHISFSKWTIKNILKKYGKSKEQIASEIKEFCYYSYSEAQIENANIQFYGYYADYDWVVFCWLFGRMIDLPNGFPMYCRDLKQQLDYILESNTHTLSDKYIYKNNIEFHPNYPKQINEHNALSDAKWNYELYKFIKNLK